MKKVISILIAFFSIVSGTNAQYGMKPDSLSVAAMQKISFMPGNWKGEGWMQMGKDKHYFIQTESITQKVNGAVLVIDGLGLDKESQKVIHQAFAIISYDLPNKKYMMRAFRADGNYIDTDVKIEEDGSFVWGFTHPQAGQMKYTIKLVNGKWVEKGEMNRDGKTWFQFFEMTLSKI